MRNQFVFVALKVKRSSDMNKNITINEHKKKIRNLDAQRAKIIIINPKDLRLKALST